MEENKDFDFNIQLFAEEGEGATVPEPTPVDNTPTEQPIEDSEGQGSQEPEQQEDFDWSIDEDGNVVFDDSVFDGKSDSEPEETDGEEQPKADEPQKFPVKINGVEQMVTLEELQKGYMQQSDLTK